MRHAVDESGGFDLAHAWREPPALATPTTMRASITFFFAFGGLLLAVCAPFMGGAGELRAVLVGAGLLAVALGALSWLIGPRLPRWCFELHVVAALGGITALAVLVPGKTTALALSAALLLPMVVSATLVSLRSATALILLGLACRAVVMLRAGGTAGEMLMLDGCTLGMVGLVAWLARSADAAERDPLTGTLNRRGLGRRLEIELPRVEHERGQLALISLDIDDFRSLNDAAGHTYGDSLIVACAAAWRAALPDGAVLSRYGADGFVILLPDTPLGRAADIADSLRAAARGEVTVSAGVAAWQPGDSGSMLITRADVALYDAKAAGRDRTAVYGDPGRAASELESAVANGEMRLLLQPLVQLSDGETFGYEALLRWHRPGRGVVAPLDFVPEAERTGAIHALGSWVMEECCRLATSLPGPRRPIAVNVSVHELRRQEYAEGVRRLLERWHTPGELLIIEVTESVFEDDDPQIIANLHDLRALRAQIAIDDFGAGYSSLRRIEHLPIDLIKVDGALISSIREGHDAAILRAIVAMGRSLGVRLLAEHVEGEHQAGVLADLGYDLAQGYYYGRPVPPVDAVRPRPATS